ncbi:hypothetical protein AOQ84DRAFT_209702 [Glonium stellatum]|uniref:C2H2-type domain-containing protein n=1 Tax=Glonium stellatum TaxID=574774 RepID=A0A8E2F5K1_9PEZI|nr:hypothetical protein AOQ84DRAFT_209702 [Glonium stellatum]
MAALREPASAFLPTFTAAALNEDYSTRRMHSFVLVEHGNVRSSIFLGFEEMSSGVTATCKAAQWQSDRIPPNHKMPTISSLLHEEFENGTRISRGSIAKVKPQRRPDLDIEAQEKLVRQDSQPTPTPISTSTSISRNVAVPVAVDTFSLSPLGRLPPLPTPPCSAPPRTETTSTQAECCGPFHKGRPSHRTKRLAERLADSMKRKFREVQGGRPESEPLACEAHEDRPSCGAHEHSAADSCRSTQRGPSNHRINSAVVIESSGPTQHQMSSKSNRKFRTWMHSLNRDSKSSHNRGAPTTAESMRSRIRSITSKAKRLFSKSHSLKSSELGSAPNGQAPEDLPPSIFYSEGPKQGSPIELDTNNASFRPHDSGADAGAPAVSNSIHDMSPPPQRYSSYAVYEENGLLELDIRIITGGPPRPFQCTFCLKPCDEESNWIQHEWSHFPQHGWTCMINGQTHVHNGWVCCSFCADVNPTHDFSQHNTDHCTDKRILDRTFTTESDLKQHLHTIHGDNRVMIGVMQSWNWPQCMNEWYWYCGFCDTILQSWDKRKEHINEHFRNGETMSTWNPLASPYPWSRQLSPFIPGFPRWEPSKLLAIQQHTILDVINKVVEPRQRNQCDLCNITPLANFGEFTRHMSLWHHPKKSWSCPSLTRGWELMNFFGSYLEHSSESTQEAYFCLCCGKEFLKDSSNSDMLNKHLQDDHHFVECHHDKTFAPELFSLHLANIHHVDFDYVGDFANLCQKEERPPALMACSKDR